MADDKKTLKFQMMMSPSEAEVLDDWMFKNRVRSRAEAIRRLTQIGLAFDARAEAMADTLLDVVAMVLNYHEDLAKDLAKEQSSGSDKNSDYQRLQEDMVRYHERMNAMLHDVAYPLYMTAEAAKTLKGNDPFEAVREKAERILKQLEQERGASSPNG